MQILLVRPRDPRPGTRFTRIRTLTLPAVAAELAPFGTVRIVDESVEPIPDEAVDLVGITCDTAHALRAWELADRFRRRGIPVVLGGTHPTALPAEALEHAHAVVQGEVEGLGRRLVADLAAGRLQGIYRSATPPDLDAVPVAPVDLLPAYHQRFQPYPFELTRGCRHACRFCFNRTIHGPGFRRRDVDQLLDAIRRRPERLLLAMDDNLMNDPALLGRFAEGLAPLGRVWGGQSTLDLADDPALLRVLRDSGFSFTFVGLESFSRASLAAEGKAFNRVEAYREQFRRLRHHGILPFAGVMVGLDHDGPEVFERTLDGLARLAPAACAFTVPVAFPGTAFHRQMVAEERLISHDRSRYDGHHVVLRPLGMEPETLQRGYHRLARRFYGWGAALRRLAHHLRPRPHASRLFAVGSYVGITVGYRRYHGGLAAEG